MEIVAIISIGLLAGALCIALGRYVWPAVRRSDAEILARAQVEVGRLGQENVALQSVFAVWVLRPRSRSIYAR